MKAPDKKYPLSVVADLLGNTPPNDVVFMPDKIYCDGVDMSTTPIFAINEEYIRKDALLEWATTNRDKLDALSDNDAVRWGQRNAFQQMIDKLNSL